MSTEERSLRLSNASSRNDELDGDRPLVSVVIPAYNASLHLGQALDSVMNQGFTNYEVLVINDGSPDTEELEILIGSYDDRVRYLKQGNLGPSAARNRGILEATGQYIAFLDADDYWHADYLAEQVSFIRSDSTMALCYTDATHVGDARLEGRRFMELSPSDGEVTFENLLGGRCTVILSGTLARKDAIVTAGLFDETLRHSEDYDLWLRIAHSGARLAYQRKVLLCKRVHDASLSNDVVKLFSGALRVLQKTEQTIRLNETEKAALNEHRSKLSAALALEDGKSRLAAGDVKSAIEYITKANRFYSSRKLWLVLLLMRLTPRLIGRLYKARAKHSHQSKKRSEAKGGSTSLTAQASWIVAAKATAFGLSFALPLLLVRKLDQGEFGLYKQVFLVVGTALNVLPLGFAMSAFYFLPRERERQGQIIFNILLFNTTIGLIAWLVLFFYPGTLTLIFNGPEMVSYANLIGLTILLWVASSFLEIIAVANQEPRLATLFIVGSQFAKTLLLVIAAFALGSVRALVYAALIQGILHMLVLLYYLRSRFASYWRGFSWAVMKTQLHYALPFGFASMFLRFQTELDNYFVAHRFEPPGFAIYSVGCFNLPLVGILSESVGSVTIPRVSQLQKQGKTREIVMLIASMTRKLAAVLFPMYVFLLITGKEFITVLFTAQYLASWPIFAINLTLIPLRLVTSGYDPVIRAYAEHRYFLIRIRAALFVTLAAGLWYATPRYGMMGAITVMISINIIERLITAMKVGRILEIKRRDVFLFKDVGKLIIASAIAGLLTAGVRSLVGNAGPLAVLVVCGLCFSGFYIAAILLLGIATQAERDSIIRRFSTLQRRFFWKRAVDPLS
jgi:O-antigen/teichoic acid export membrane protein/glycosyltransferase involved in cell wall biosynthesis